MAQTSVVTASAQKKAAGPSGEKGKGFLPVFSIREGYGAENCGVPAQTWEHLLFYGYWYRVVCAGTVQHSDIIRKNRRNVKAILLKIR